MDGDGVINAVVLVLILSIALVVGIAAIDAVSDPVDVEQRSSTVLLDGTGETVHIESYGSGSDETVRNSLGNAIAVTGANDSYVATDGLIGLDLGENFTVSQGAWVSDASTNEEMVVLALGSGDLLLRYDGPNNQWQVWLYRPPGDTYVANVSVDDPTNGSVVTAVRADDDLTIYRNGTAGETVDLSQPSDAGIGPDGENFNGTIDETRIFQAAVASADVDALASDPIHPVGEQELARLMYDDVSDSTVPVYYTGTSATASNTSVVDGFEGEVMEASGWLFTRDYDWETRGPKITPEEGGLLDPHPVVFVDYEYDRSGGVVIGISNALDMSGVIPVAIIAGVIVLIVARFRE